MPKTALEQWDETAINNTDMGGIDLQENVMRPPAVNNEMREHMAQMAKWLGDDTVASATTADLGAVPGRYINITGTTTITGFGTIKAGTVKYVKFAGALTLTHNGTSLILPGAANITTAAGDAAIFVSEGSGNWRCLAYQVAATPPNAAVTRAAVASTSGTAINFTDIPAWARRIEISFQTVSTNGTSNLQIQLGDAGGYETSGYVASSQSRSSVGISHVDYTSGFGLRIASATGSLNGTLTLTCLDPAQFLWTIGGELNDAGNSIFVASAGYKATSAALDRLRVTTVNGTDAFDAGAIGLRYSA